MPKTANILVKCKHFLDMMIRGVEAKKKCKRLLNNYDINIKILKKKEKKKKSRWIKKNLGGESRIGVENIVINIAIISKTRKETEYSCLVYVFSVVISLVELT